VDYHSTLVYLLSRAGADQVNGGEVNGNWSLPFMKKASMGLICLSLMATGHGYS